MNTHIPKIALTLGDPCGIGPEVALKAANYFASRTDIDCLLVGPLDVAFMAESQIGKTLAIRAVDRPDSSQVGSVDILPISTASMSYLPGHPTSNSARTATDSVRRATTLALSGEVDGLACAPVDKRGLLLDDARVPGHSKLIAGMCDSPTHEMYFIGPKVHALSVTGHLELRKVHDSLTERLIEEKAELAIRTYTSLQGRPPRVGIMAFDPHAGEAGLLGRFDVDTLAPTIRRLTSHGYDISGPHPADAIFRPYILQRFDLLIGLYHDQVKAPIAALNSDNFYAYLAGVNIIRTTTTHGTALDIAGRGVADPTNMIRAVTGAVECSLRHRSREVEVYDRTG